MNGDIATFLVFAIPAAIFPAVCILNRAAGVAVLAALLPAYLLRTAISLPGTGLPGLPTTLLEILFLELFAVWLFTDGLKKDAWRPLGRWASPLALILIGAVAGSLISPDPRAAAGLLRAYFIEPVLFFVVFADVVRNAGRRLAVLAGLGACLLVVGLIAIIQKETGYGIPNPVWQAEATRRVTAFFGFPNAIGLYAAPVIILMSGWAVALFRSPEPRLRLLAAGPAVAAALGCVAVLFAVSEGAIIAVAAGLVCLGLMTKPLRAPTLILIIAACLTVSLYRPALNYASGIVSLRDDSGSVRLIIWRETAEMLADHPVFGAGLAGYRQIIAPYHQARHIEIFMYPHNFVMNFWSEIGLIGLAGFVWILIKFFNDVVGALRRRRGGWLHRTLIAAMIAVLVHGLVDVPYLKNDLAFLFFILIGLAESLSDGGASRPKTAETGKQNKAARWLPAAASGKMDENTRT